VVFLATWLLHGYQLYWLRGGWGFTVPDALFWGTLGGLVAVNVQLDARRHPARRAPAAGGRGGARELAVRAAKIAGTFTTIALLWSLWSSPSLGAWLDMLGRGLGGSWSFHGVQTFVEQIVRGPYGG
jgi:alginate O-acetyltransferase complex protein AlgI